MIEQNYNKRAIQKIQNIIQNDKDLRWKAIKMRKQLMDLQKELHFLNSELEEEQLESESAWIGHERVV